MVMLGPGLGFCGLARFSVIAKTQRGMPNSYPDKYPSCTCITRSHEIQRRNVTTHLCHIFGGISAHLCFQGIRLCPLSPNQSRLLLKALLNRCIPGSSSAFSSAYAVRPHFQNRPFFVFLAKNFPSTSPVTLTIMAAAVSAKSTLLRLIDESGKRLGKLTAYDFYTAWSKYDKDGSGFIEDAELTSFLKEFLTTIGGMSSADALTTGALNELATAFLAQHDKDKDGRISINELSALLPTDQTFLMVFRQSNPLESSEEFMRTWKTFDKDRSGYIDASELKEFLAHILKAQKLDDAKLAEYSKTLLEIFDTNKDGNLSLSEAAQLLPVKENFLYSVTKKTDLKSLEPAKISEIFKKYDLDNSGSIAASELDGLILDVLRIGGKKPSQAEVDTLKEALIRGCDVDGDGRIDEKELVMIFKALQN